MSAFVEIMLLPLLACLVLTGIHTYLGLHVVRRGVIFLDLALAQVAALGATFGFLLGYGLHSGGSYLVSLALTSIAAAAFAVLRLEKSPVPQEALVGIVYVVASAACVLVLSRVAEGGEELKNLLVGHLLFVDLSEILKILGVYAAVGILHFIFRRRFILLSENLEEARAQGLNLRLWDFLFYLSFGLVVTSSVEIGGVLLVFSYLIVPAVCASLLQATFRGQLLVGWGLGVLASVAGMLFSYQFDLPTGATIVCVFGGLAFGIFGLVSMRAK
jgi:zinc/manganese transport system permease protein